MHSSWRKDSARFKAVATVWKAEQKCVTWDAYVERRSDGYWADYINMMLHLDIIGFNIMLHAVREQTENIDRLVTIVGSWMR